MKLSFEFSGNTYNVVDIQRGPGEDVRRIEVSTTKDAVDFDNSLIAEAVEGLEKFDLESCFLVLEGGHPLDHGAIFEFGEAPILEPTCIDDQRVILISDLESRLATYKLHFECKYGFTPESCTTRLLQDFKVPLLDTIAGISPAIRQAVDAIQDVAKSQFSSGDKFMVTKKEVDALIDFIESLKVGKHAK